MGEAFQTWWDDLPPNQRMNINRDHAHMAFEAGFRLGHMATLLGQAVDAAKEGEGK